MRRTARKRKLEESDNEEDEFPQVAHELTIDESGNNEVYQEDSDDEKSNDGNSGDNGGSEDDNSNDDEQYQLRDKTLNQLYNEYGIHEAAKSRQAIAKLSDVRVKSAKLNLKLYKHPLCDCLYDRTNCHPFMTSHFMKSHFFEKPAKSKRGAIRFKQVDELKHMFFLEDGKLDRSKCPGKEIHQGHSVDRADFQCSDLLAKELLKTPNLICQTAANNTGINNFIGVFRRWYIRTSCPDGAHIMDCIVFDPSRSELHLLTEKGQPIPRYLSTSICYKAADGKFTCLTFLRENKKYPSKELPKLVVKLEAVEKLTNCTLFAGIKRSKIKQLTGIDIDSECKRLIKSSVCRIYGVSGNKLIFADPNFKCTICHKPGDYAMKVEGEVVCLTDAKFYKDEKRFRTVEECEKNIGRINQWITGDEVCEGCRRPIKGNTSQMETENPNDDKLPICGACYRRLNNDGKI